MKRQISKLGYRTPDIFRRNIKHQIVKNKIHVKISKACFLASSKINPYGKAKKES